MLQSRELLIGPDDASYPIDATHVYATNEYCAVWNNSCLESIQGTLYTCPAFDTSKFQHTCLVDVAMPTKVRLTGNLRTTCKFKVGARVMITTNIDVADGLTNGVMGTVSNVVMKVVNGRSQVHVILVKFDSAKVGVDAIASSKYSHIDAHSVPIHKVQAMFKIKDRVTGQVSHTHFPLILA